FYLRLSSPVIYPLSLHDALPIFVSPAAADRLRLSRIADSVCLVCSSAAVMEKGKVVAPGFSYFLVPRFSSLRNRSFLSPLCLAVDRKSTRLNSSHDQISYAVFCL